MRSNLSLIPCKKVCENLGGSIKCHSVEGAGNTFTFTMQIQKRARNSVHAGVNRRTCTQRLIPGLSVIQEALESQQTNSEGSCLNNVEGPDLRLSSDELTTASLQYDMICCGGVELQIPSRSQTQNAEESQNSGL